MKQINNSNKNWTGDQNLTCKGLILSANNFQTDEIGYEVCSLMPMIFVKQ